MHHVNIDSKKSAKLMSITQDLINLASGGRNPSPKSIALAMALRQMTGSASVIYLLSGLGHCMSHSYVLSHETALAQLNISNDSTVPPVLPITSPPHLPGTMTTFWRKPDLEKAPLTSLVESFKETFQNTHTPGFETCKFQNIFIYSTQ